MPETLAANYLKLSEIQNRIHNLERASLHGNIKTVAQNVLIDLDLDKKVFDLLRILSAQQSYQFVLPLQRGQKIQNILEVYKACGNSRVSLRPTAFDVRDIQTLSVAEVYKLTQELAQNGIEAKPEADLKLVVTLDQPKFEVRINFSHSNTPKISVIIPTRNYQTFVVNVIRHLILQDIETKKFEIILVDDGGEDQTEDYILQLVGPIKSQINFKYIYVQRETHEKTAFRAGICRNIGTELARGEYLLFLDSDMLVPQDFLRELLVQFNDADVIQCPRWHINPEKSDSFTELSSLLPADRYIEEASYWMPFFESKNWAELPFYWRYTCTYCLAISRENFLQLGGFNQNFRSYGFEDTDLGYRGAKAHLKFKMWNKYVYHLTPPKDKARYRHSLWRKQILLSKTGKIFYLLHLDPEIYKLFWPYMQSESRWKQRLFHVFKRLLNRN
ncbi:MAG: glycosyltransferase [Bdellovibrionia bacterium]